MVAMSYNFTAYMYIVQAKRLVTIPQAALPQGASALLFAVPSLERQ